MSDRKYLSTDPNAGTPIAPMKPVASHEPAPQPGSKASIIMQATSRALPVAEGAAMNFATSPNVPKAFAKAGRVLGAVAPVAGGYAKGGMAGAAIGAAGSAQGAWAGGKTGWFTGRLAQQLMMPVARVMEVVAPYAQALGTLSGAQGVLDLAQMADPDRRDIGVLGVGKTQDKEAREQFAANWDAWMASYPQSVGKAKWSALNPTQRLEGFKAFMQTQTKAGKE